MGSKCQDLNVAKLLGVNTERVESSVANWSRCLLEVTYCIHKQIHITYALYLLTPSITLLHRIQCIPQGSGSHSGLRASSPIGAFPSRILSRVNLAASRITDIVCRPSCSPESLDRLETAATSGSGGTRAARRERPLPNAMSGCRFPNRRIRRSVVPSAPRAALLFPTSVSTYGRGLAERSGDARSG